MTLVIIDLHRPGISGDHVPARGRLLWTPTLRRNVDGAVVLPAAFSVSLDSLGHAETVAAPTASDWCWKVTELVPGGITRYVAVPDVATAEYELLVDVDPTTLSPNPTPPLPAWDVALSEHVSDTTNVHGIADTSLLETQAGAQAKVNAEAAARVLYTDAAEADANSYTDAQVAAASAGSSAALTAHITDPSDAHDASAISFVPGGSLAATDVQGAVTETAAEATAHAARTDNPHSVTKAQVGLGNVDNTSDASKPVSTAQAAADALKVAKAGDTMSGDLSIVKATPMLIFDASAGTPSMQRFRLGGIRRWEVDDATNGDAYRITSYDAAGANPVIQLQANRPGNYVEVQGVRNFSGTGFPEGVVAAPVGSRYVDTAATNGAVEWVKATGTGTTGWKVVYGDTGLRTLISWDAAGVITKGSLPAEWVPRTGAAGSVRFRRVNSWVMVDLTNIQANATSTSVRFADPLPAGFVPNVAAAFAFTGFTAANAAKFAGLQVLSNGIGRGAGITLTAGDYWGQNHVTYVTNDTWPATLP